MITHKTVLEEDFKFSKEDLLFNLQPALTRKLDNWKGNFDQGLINEIVLWKVNRYVGVNEPTLKLINELDPEAAKLDIAKTRMVLKALLLTKGIQLPMASTILRFRNSNIYQIIDQRVFRVIYKGKKLKLKLYPSEKNLEEQIDLYIQYLNDLRGICKELDLPYNEADRALFKADKRINKGIPLDNYSAKTI